MAKAKEDVAIVDEPQDEQAEALAKAAALLGKAANDRQNRAVILKDV